MNAYTKKSLVVAASFFFLIIYPYLKLQFSKEIFFSHDSGYYDQEFYLSILGGGGYTIHYTTDGSEPTINDPVFDDKSPLYIDDATNHPNIYSERIDTSTGFLTDLIRQYTEGIPDYALPDHNYTVPNYAIDKCTVIRASVFDSYGNCLDSITGSYFVGFQSREIYQDIYTASIVTSPENLFDEETGIYVTGKTFSQFLENTLGQEGNWSNPYWHWWTSNYSNRGFDWERKASITIFDNHKHTVLSENCGIRIKGGGSRGLLPKSISCYARDIYNGSDNFQSDIFHTNIHPHKIVFFSGGDDIVFKLKDYLANTMEQDLHFATMDFIPCAMFLDGEYWGMYYIMEDYNAEYIHSHYQVANNNIIMVKNDSISEGNEEDILKYEEMRTFINNHDMSNTENYNHACDLIDIDSYIDYYAAQIYIGRYNDWPFSNFALWRTRENDGSLYGDCKWRWMLFDVNSGGLSIDQLSVDTLSNVLLSDSTFSSLYKNEEFRIKFASRLLYIGREVYNPQKCNQFLDDYARTLKGPLLYSNMRFYTDSKSDEFDKNVNDMKTFFSERYDIIWDCLITNMGKEWLLENGIQR